MSLRPRRSQQDVGWRGSTPLSDRSAPMRPPTRSISPCAAATHFRHPKKTPPANRRRFIARLSESSQWLVDRHDPVACQFGRAFLAADAAEGADRLLFLAGCSIGFAQAQLGFVR